MPLAPVPAIRPDDLAAHIAAGDVFVIDVRGKGGEQIYGAIRCAPQRIEHAADLKLPLPHGDGLIVLYDEDGTSELVQDIARNIIEEGYGVVRVLAGGYQGWLAAGGRCEPATVEQPVTDAKAR